MKILKHSLQPAFPLEQRLARFVILCQKIERWQMILVPPNLLSLNVVGHSTENYPPLELCSSSLCVCKEHFMPATYDSYVFCMNTFHLIDGNPESTPNCLALCCSINCSKSKTQNCLFRTFDLVLTENYNKNFQFQS